MGGLQITKREVGSQYAQMISEQEKGKVKIAESWTSGWPGGPNSRDREP